MENNQGDLLRQLLADFESRTVDNYRSLVTTVTTVIKNVFGEKSEFAKKAKALESGWGVKGAVGYANEQCSNGKYEQSRFQAYKDLLNEAITAVEVYGVGNCQSEQVDDGKPNVFSIHTINANGSVLSFGDMTDVTISLDNSVETVQREIDERATGKEAEELSDLLKEVKEYLAECQDEQKMLKKPGLCSRLNAHAAKHGWFYGAVLQLIGTYVIQYFG